MIGSRGRAAIVRGVVVVVALVALALTAAPGWGSTIGIEPNAVLGGDAVVYRAAPGEANQFFPLGQNGDQLLFQEGFGAIAITPLAPCAAAAAFPGQPRFAQCPAANITGVAAFLGDLPDNAGAMNPMPLLLDGQADNDTLSGGVGDDLLLGGDGNDVMLGEGGNDILDGGAGADELAGNARLPDDLGFDMADYGDRIAPVTVTLDGRRNDGEAGEGDLLDVDMDDVNGGAANDALTGDAGSNALFGNDGDDTLDGGAGADMLDGGNGNDTILARDSTADTVVCGLGTDTVVADAVDSVVGCETVSLPVIAPPVTPPAPAPPAPAPPAPPAPVPPAPGPTPKDTVAPTVRLAPLGTARVGTALRRGLRLTLTCSEACTARGVARWRGRRVATGAASAVAGVARRLTLRFTLAAKRSLRRVRSATLSLTITATDATGNRRTTTRSLRLRR